MIVAFFSTIFTIFKEKVLRRRFYSEFKAFMFAVAAVKLHGDAKNDTGRWEDVAPTIYDVDAITKEMNDNCRFINKTFHLSANEWQRDDIRRYLDILDTYHSRLSNVLEKDISLLELCARYNTLSNLSLANLFKLYFAIHMSNKLDEQR